MPRELLMMQNSFQWGTAEGQTLEIENAIRSNVRDLKIEGQTYQNLVDENNVKLGNYSYNAGTREYSLTNPETDKWNELLIRYTRPVYDGEKLLIRVNIIKNTIVTTSAQSLKIAFSGDTNVGQEAINISNNYTGIFEFYCNNVIASVPDNIRISTRAYTSGELVVKDIQVIPVSSNPLSYTDNTKEYISTKSEFNYIYSLSNLKANTIYTLSYEIKSSNKITTNNITHLFRIEIQKADGTAGIPVGFTGTVDNIYRKYKLTFNTGSDTVQTKINLRNCFNDPGIGLTENTLSVRNLVLLEGDYTNRAMITELPTSINGIESVAEREKESDLYPVKITNKGKNLLDLSSFNPISTSTIQASKEGNVFTIKGLKTDTEESYTHLAACNLKVYLEENKTYTFSFKSDGEFGGTVGTDTVELLFMLDGTTKNYFKVQGQNTVTIPRGFTGYYYVRFDVNSGDKTHKFWDIQVEEGDTVTDYEPYRESTLTEISLPQPLRSLPNGVCDEVVGNKLIQRVGKIIVDGTNNISISVVRDNTIRLFLTEPTIKNITYGSTLPFLSDTLLKTTSCWESDVEGIYQDNKDNRFVVSISKNKLGGTTINDIKAYFAENPITLYYELATPIEHTINIPPISIAKGTNMVTTNNNIKPELTFKYKRKYKKSSTNNIKYLYNSGNEYSDITGGWRLTHKGSNSENYMVKNTDNIEVYGVSGASGIEVGTTNKISWEDYDRICYEIEKIDVGDKGIFIINFVDTVGSTAWENTQVTRGFDANTLGNTFTIKIEKPSGLSYTNGYIGIFTDHYWQQTSVCPMRFKIKKVWLEKSDTVVLYSNGNECLDITGGYLTSSNNSATCNIEKQADNLYVNCTGKTSFDSICYTRTNKTIKPCKIKVSVKNNSISANGIAFCMFLSEKEAITSVSDFDSVVNKKYIKASNTTQGQYVDLEMDLTDNTEGYFYVFCMTAGSADYTCKANIRKIEIIR